MVKFSSAPELFSPAIPRWLALSALLLRMGMGAFFLASGILKALDPGAFVLDVRSFQMVDDPWPALIALVLPWLEVLCGLALIIGRGVPGALLLLAGAMAVFITALGVAWSRGLDVTCGCFGRSENKTHYPLQIGLDVALLLILIFLFRVRRRAEGGSAAGPLSGR